MAGGAGGGRGDVSFRLLEELRTCPLKARLRFSCVQLRDSCSDEDRIERVVKGLNAPKTFSLNHGV